MTWYICTAYCIEYNKFSVSFLLFCSFVFFLLLLLIVATIPLKYFEYNLSAIRVNYFPFMRVMLFLRHIPRKIYVDRK
jgi:hypothetical protein